MAVSTNGVSCRQSLAVYVSSAVHAPLAETRSSRPANGTGTLCPHRPYATGMRVSFPSPLLTSVTAPRAISSATDSVFSSLAGKT